MKVTPMAAPAAAQAPSPQANDARSRAISMLTSQPAAQPVMDQNAISPEEMAVVAPKLAKIDSETEEEGQVADSSIEETEEPVKEDPAISRQFAQLARQEKALRAREAAFKAQEQALRARENDMQTKYQAPDMSKYIDRSRLQTDALSVLAEAGISYDTLTEQLINQTPVDPRMQSHIDKLEAKLAALEAKAVENDTKMSAQQQAQYDAAVRQIESDAKKLVFTDPEFETIKETGSVKDVVSLIKSHFEETGEVLSVEEAAREVEEFLVEEYSKLARLGKIQKRLAPKPETKPAIQAQPQTPNKQQPQQMKTLTNNVSSNRQLSAKERAILAFKGEKF